ncbi:MAG: CoA transferase [Candidatus Aminicenantes bacterium]|nr:CoA transferase [Candidatus Aminicenantes bacterium]
MTNKALSHIRVIDLTEGIAGPYCTKLLSGYGAEVIKIEDPKTGDMMRGGGPFFKNGEGLETSIPFLWLNTGKKSVTLDLKTEKGPEILKQLVKDADVLMESFSPGVMSGLGLGYEVFREINPRLIMTSISNFGQTGPYKDYQAEEIELNALSGGMYVTGDPEKAPLASGPALYQYTAGQHAFVATLMAVYRRGLDGEGQHVDVSIQESGLEHIEITLSYCLQQGKNARRGGHLFVPWDAYECRDGYAVVIAMPYRHWHRAAEVFSDHRLFAKKYDHILDRMKHRREYEEILRPCVKALGKKYLFYQGQSRGLAFAYVAGLDEVLESPQHKDRIFFEEMDHPAVGRHKYCGAPFRMSETPWQSARAPLLGEHNQDVFGEGLRVAFGGNSSFCGTRKDTDNHVKSGV